MNTYKRHRFPPDIISYAVWLYYRFNLSHRDIEDLLAQRGITVSREPFRSMASSITCGELRAGIGSYRSTNLCLSFRFQSRKVCEESGQ
jgi:hypothetical protein